MVVLIAAGCSGGADSATGDAPGLASPPLVVAEDESSGSGTLARDDLRPGAGRTVTLARGEEFDMWFSATVYERLLAELGYTVTPPAAPLGVGLGAEAGFAAVARGQVDVWTGALFPLHEALLDSELDGEQFRDTVVPLGVQSPSGVMEGILASRDWVVANGIFHIDDLTTAANAADFDVDGNGVPDIFGCRMGTTCSAVLDRLILTNEWNIEQITSADESILNTAIARIAAGEPTLTYGWTPGAVVAALQPGRDVVWMSVRQPNPDWSNEAVGIAPQDCPARPCVTGFGASDNRTVVNVNLVEREPIAAALIEAVSIPATDVSIQNEQLSNITGTGTELNADELVRLELEVDRLASEWIGAHRAEVSGWLEFARAAR